MEDLEKECEDALFKLCDARERYPARCAEELQKCIRLNNDIQMIRVSSKPAVKLDIPTMTEQQKALVGTNVVEVNGNPKYSDLKVQKMMDTLDNLKSVVEQIEREKKCEMNRLLKS